MPIVLSQGNLLQWIVQYTNMEISSVPCFLSPIWTPMPHSASKDRKSMNYSTKAHVFACRLFTNFPWGFPMMGDNSIVGENSTLFCYFP
ncbi:hypothetical protein CRM22_002967 [Opisthorchis felineus]|uniref:Uncharacterized protein n=1 Tax=Opisthorchis felineus TaxID=147828 RepID=A0A4V3SG39_OPIFE|nr:hypothetical protein CRM22_002967 [Opisthorchis felineus]